MTTIGHLINELTVAGVYELCENVKSSIKTDKAESHSAANKWIIRYVERLLQMKSGITFGWAEFWETTQMLKGSAHMAYYSDITADNNDPLDDDVLDMIDAIADRTSRIYVSNLAADAGAITDTEA